MLVNSGRLAVVRGHLIGPAKLLANAHSNSRMLLSTTMEDNKQEVFLESIGNKGLITLNRPKALNALNMTMVRQITPALKQWEDEHKVMIIIQGTGGKVHSISFKMFFNDKMCNFLFITGILCRWRCQKHCRVCKKLRCI